jgi:hypothetical protein
MSDEGDARHITGARRRYVVAPLPGGSKFGVDISAEEFHTTIRAIEALIHCVEIEEKFNLIIENYAEIERRIFNQSLSSLIGAQFDDLSAQDFRTDVGRILLNFLASVRLYQDSIQRHINGIVPGISDVWSHLGAQMSHEFDTNQHYRIMEGLRNYAQHRALSVHGYMIDNSWDDSRTILSFEMKPFVRLTDLAKDAAFRGATLTELQTGPDMLELK